MLFSKNTLEVALKEAFAERHDLTLVEPKDNQLFILIDCFADRRIFDTYFERFQEKFPTATYTMSKSWNNVEGRHITVTVPGKNFTNTERIAYQAALGSCRKRELLSLFDILRGGVLPTFFLEKK